MKKLFPFLFLMISVVSFSQTKRDTITNVIIGDTAYKTVRLKTWVTKSKTASITYVDTTTTMTPIKQFVGSQPPANQLPVCNGGGNQSILLPVNSVTLTGSATDADGTITSYLWTKTSGPSTFVIESPSSPATSITNLITAGNYVFRLTATDNDAGTCTSSVTVTVNAVPPPPDTSSNKIEGFGITKGGEGQPIVRVTNLNASGAGSLKAAIGSNRTIVFDVGGTINGFRWDGGNGDANNIVNLTIDGSTAPAPGITLNNNNNGNTLGFEGSSNHDIIIKYIRATNAGGDNLHVANGSYKIVFDHCAAWGARDGNCDITTDAHDITVQYCIFGKGADNSWSGNMLLGYGTKNVSVHHNLFSPRTPGGSDAVGERNPNVSFGTGCSNPNYLYGDFRNNVVYNWGRANGTGSGYGTGIFNCGSANVVNNYYYTSNPSANGAAVVINNDGYGNGVAGLAYVSGNFSGNNSNFPNSNHAEWPIPTAAQIQLQTPCDAAKKVKEQAGVRYGNVPLSSVEQALINALILPGCN